MNTLNMHKTSLQRYATQKLVITERGGTEWLAHRDEDFLVIYPFCAAWALNLLKFIFLI